MSFVSPPLISPLPLLLLQCTGEATFLADSVRCAQVRRPRAAMVFAHGEQCWNGPTRSAVVELRSAAYNEATVPTHPPLVPLKAGMLLAGSCSACRASNYPPHACTGAYVRPSRMHYKSQRQSSAWMAATILFQRFNMPGVI
eukprot:978748-Pleurochrysis_carterae.AAC.1